MVNEAAEFATHDPEPDPSELYTDVYAPVASRTVKPHAHTRIDARAVAHDGEGQPRQMAQERRRRGQIRRRDRRDRDRQGHHGGRGGRRGHARQDPGAGRHQRCRGQHADRDDPGRRRGRLRAQGRCQRLPPSSSRRRSPRSSRRARNPRRQRHPNSRGEAGARARAAEIRRGGAAETGGRCPSPTCRKAPRWRP